MSVRDIDATGDSEDNNSNDTNTDNNNNNKEYHRGSNENTFCS